MTVPRYLQPMTTDAAGLRTPVQLPEPLPYNVEPRDVLRLVEDLHELLHEINGQLVQKGYERLEELLDPAGFSGLLSRAVVDKMGRLSKRLVMNQYHNGYPDLLPRGTYLQDKAQHGTEGGLEVKASRYDGGWQSHGPRAGWFLIVQFWLDENEEVAVKDREPTQVRAALIAHLERDDWSWQPAKEGKIRSGTASVKASGVVKMRSGAVWVAPGYEDDHQALLKNAKKSVLRDSREEAVLGAVATQGGRISRDDLYLAVAYAWGLGDEDVWSTVDSAIRSLVKASELVRSGRGTTTELALPGA